MFPAGAAGVALLILRITVSASLLVDGTDRWALVTSWWSFLLFVLPALLIILGLLTPYSCALEVLVLAGVAIHFAAHDRFHLILAAVNSGALGLLGPGAFSADAYIFGRRLLTIPPRE
jgi:hypothetical protein